MNKIKDKNKDPLANLFAELPQEKLSGDFRMNIMSMIRQEEVRLRKRNHIWSIIGIVIGCICMAGTSIYTFITIDWEQYQLPTLSWTPTFSLYSYILFLTGILLFLDYQFRKIYRKKHSKETD